MSNRREMAATLQELAAGVARGDITEFHVDWAELHAEDAKVDIAFSDAALQRQRSTTPDATLEKAG